MLSALRSINKFYFGAAAIGAAAGTALAYKVFRCYQKSAAERQQELSSKEYFCATELSSALVTVRGGEGSVSRLAGEIRADEEALAAWSQSSAVALHDLQLSERDLSELAWLLSELPTGCAISLHNLTGPTLNLSSVVDGLPQSRFHLLDLEGVILPEDEMNNLGRRLYLKGKQGHHVTLMLGDCPEKQLRALTAGYQALPDNFDWERESTEEATHQHNGALTVQFSGYMSSPHLLGRMHAASDCHFHPGADI